MKITIKRKNQKEPKEYEVKYVLIDIAIELGKDAPDDFPLVFKRRGNACLDKWVVCVEIETGMIEGWKQGYAGNLYAKMVELGNYYLMDADKNIVDVINGYEYVPNKLIPPANGSGYHIELEIDENGKISNWYENPSLKDFEEDDEDEDDEDDDYEDDDYEDDDEDVEY
jgi:hypothetical protein